jgi:hypothetical protein
VPTLVVTILIVVGSMSQPGLSLAAAIAGAAPVIGAAFSVPWFFIGESRPSRLNSLDVGPRTAGTLVGVAAILLTGDILAFVLGQLAGQLASATLSAISIRRRYPRGAGARITRREIISTYRSQASGFLTSVISSGYQNAPLLIASLVAPGQLPVYAMADRLYRIATLALSPVLNLAQGYVPAASGRAAIAARAVTTVKLSVVMSGGVVLGFGILAPLAALLLSQFTIEMPLMVSFPLAVALAASVTAGITGRACLIALGSSAILPIAAASAAAVGIAVMLFFGWLLGVSGVAIGSAIAELVSASILLTSLMRRVRGERQREQTNGEEVR